MRAACPADASAAAVVLKNGFVVIVTMMVSGTTPVCTNTYVDIHVMCVIDMCGLLFMCAQMQMGCPADASAAAVVLKNGFVVIVTMMVSGTTPVCTNTYVDIHVMCVIDMCGLLFMCARIQMGSLFQLLTRGLCKYSMFSLYSKPGLFG